MLYERIQALNLPEILRFSDGRKVETAGDWEHRKEEIRTLICRDEYGFLPPAPEKLKVEITEEQTVGGGKAECSKVLLTATVKGRNYTFPVYSIIPDCAVCVPAFIHISFSGANMHTDADKIMTPEEICDQGFAVFTLYYDDVTSDDGDFTNGLAGCVYSGAARDGSSPGKIALWAWAAMRVMDYAQTLDSIDKKNIAVIGHSRLGKTALFTGAMDERFAFTISNNSGCSGAALSRGKTGETIRNITEAFPYWFCENYKTYAGREEEQPFDQHFVMALAAPRRVYAASGASDDWCDPESEFLACAAAGKVYEFLGEKGFICPDRFLKPGESLHEGGVGYHLREGGHGLTVYDWHKYVAYMRRHRNK